jgi:hypothetical protein
VLWIRNDFLSGSGSDFPRYSRSDLVKVSVLDPEPTSHFFPMLQIYSISSVVYLSIYLWSRSGSDLVKIADLNPDPDPLMLKVSFQTLSGSSMICSPGSVSVIGMRIRIIMDPQ